MFNYGKKIVKLACIIATQIERKKEVTQSLNEHLLRTDEKFFFLHRIRLSSKP